MSHALDEDQEFLESLKVDFIEETLENLEKCEECLLKYENNKEDGRLREYLRLLHSIKGSARAVEFDMVASAIHQIEALGQKAADPQFVELSLSLVDDIREVMKVLKEKDIAEMEIKLKKAIERAVL